MILKRAIRFYLAAAVALLAACGLFSALFVPVAAAAMPRSADDNSVVVSGAAYPVVAEPNGPAISIVSAEEVSRAGELTFHNPARIAFAVGEGAYVEKNDAGRPGYLISQTEGQLQAGWDLRELSQIGASEARLTLRNLEGPGDVYVWQDGGAHPFGDLKVGAGASTSKNAPTAAGANWLFSAPGTYKLTFVAEATTPTGNLISDPAVITFVVGDRAVAERSKGAQVLGAPASEPENPQSTDPNKSDNHNTPGKASTDAPSSGPGLANSGGSNGVVQCIPTPVETGHTAGAVTTKVGGTHTIAANTHVHPNWVFTKPGTYKVTITQSAKMRSGRTASARGTLTFVVGGRGNANSGHFDVGTKATASGIQMIVKDDRRQPASWVSPDSLTFGLGDAAKVTAPKGIEFIAAAGEQVWMISSSQVAGVPWVGANTMRPDLATNTTGAVTWRLDAVSGPGALAVFESGNFGSIVGQQWFGGAQTASGKPLVTYVGKTPSGEDCELDPKTVEQLESQGYSVASGGALPFTGTTAASSITVAALLTMAGDALVLARRRARR